MKISAKKQALLDLEAAREVACAEFETGRWERFDRNFRNALRDVVNKIGGLTIEDILVAEYQSTHYLVTVSCIGGIDTFEDVVIHYRAEIGLNVPVEEALKKFGEDVQRFRSACAKARLAVETANEVRRALGPLPEHRP